MRTAAEIEMELHAALVARDMRGVDALLSELMLVDPLHAELILSAIDFRPDDHVEGPTAIQ
jgi:hypothetical protein